MELRISFSIDGYNIEEIINTSYDIVSNEIINSSYQVYIFEQNYSLFGSEAVIFLKDLVNKNILTVA